MLRAFLPVIVLILAVIAGSAHAATNFNQPDLLSVGVGSYDFDKVEKHKKSTDLRGEYRWGLSLLPLINPYFRSWDSVVQFHPMAGLELTTYNQMYALGGYDMDLYMGRHFVFTWGEGVGLLARGEALRMGSAVEFRSMAELGYRFSNDIRVTGQVSHISNAGLTRRNPGAEIAGVYLHIPINLLEHHHSPTRSANEVASGTAR